VKAIGLSLFLFPHIFSVQRNRNKPISGGDSEVKKWGKLREKRKVGKTSGKPSAGRTGGKQEVSGYLIGNIG
jgi:hypothetical protein